MADLYNLQDEIDEELQEEEPTFQEEEEPTQDAYADDDDGADEEEAKIPAALEELEQRRLYPEDNDEAAVEEEAAELGDDTDEAQQVGESALYKELKQVWQQEVACPELLPYNQPMVEALQQELEQREDDIAALGEDAGDMEALLASILKVDGDRAKYMLHDLLRTRLQKIQEYPLHMIGLQDRMGGHELDFLKGYGKLTESHMRRTVLDHCAKEAIQNLNDDHMVDNPNLDEYVFVKVKETSEINSGSEDEPSFQQHEAGTTLICRYNVIRGLFAEGKVELYM